MSDSKVSAEVVPIGFWQSKGLKVVIISDFSRREAYYVLWNYKSTTILNLQ